MMGFEWNPKSILDAFYNMADPERSREAFLAQPGPSRQSLGANLEISSPVAACGESTPRNPHIQMARSGEI